MLTFVELQYLEIFDTSFFISDFRLFNFANFSTFFSFFADWRNLNQRNNLSFILFMIVQAKRKKSLIELQWVFNVNF